MVGSSACALPPTPVAPVLATLTARGRGRRRRASDTPETPVQQQRESLLLKLLDLVADARSSDFRACDVYDRCRALAALAVPA